EIASEKPGDLAPYGLVQPDLTFSLIDASGKPLGRILASQTGSDTTSNAYAMAEGGDGVYQGPGDLSPHVDKHDGDFRAPRPTPQTARSLRAAQTASAGAGHATRPIRKHSRKPTRRARAGSPHAGSIEPASSSSGSNPRSERKIRTGDQVST